MKEILAIAGSHPRAAETFDFDRTDCDIWVFNEALTNQIAWMKRADAVFQMHVEAIWKNPKNRNDPKHYEWLKSGETPTIYMQEQYPDVPKSVRFPLEEIKRELLPTFHWQGRNKEGDHYFSSTFCYALALGIYLGYQKIECHGIEMETDTEYRYQRDGVTFWIGIALGRHIQIDIHTDIFNFPLYGYEGEVTIGADEFEKQITELRPLLEQKKQEYGEAVKRADEAVMDFLAHFKNPDLVVETLKDQIQKAYEMNIIGGRIQENEKYKAKADAMTQETGFFQFSRQEFEAALQGLMQDYHGADTEAKANAGACTALFAEARKHKNYDRRKRAMRDFVGVAKAYLEKSMYVGLFQGAAMENERFLQMLDHMIKAAGGVKSEAVLLEAHAQI